MVVRVRQGTSFATFLGRHYAVERPPLNSPARGQQRNILSHNDSRESMLRFESRDLVHEILQDLGIGSALGDDLGLKTDVEAPGDETTSAVACSVCGGAMRLFETVGIWLCSSSPRCPGIRSIGSVEIEAEAEILELTDGEPCTYRSAGQREVASADPTCFVQSAAELLRFDPVCPQRDDLGVRWAGNPNRREPMGSHTTKS